ncbi:hypothetical protein BKA57DRAFT_66708 [Linnemannia elongata]|nr:hypothetical protein BKA57DRAFT_66708 [Linnemannia elongata]
MLWLVSLIPITRLHFTLHVTSMAATSFILSFFSRTTLLPTPSSILLFFFSIIKQPVPDPWWRRPHKQHSVTFENNYNNHKPQKNIQRTLIACCLVLLLFSFPVPARAGGDIWLTHWRPAREERCISASLQISRRKTSSNNNNKIKKGDRACLFLLI